MEEVKNEIKEEKPKRTKKQKIFLTLEIVGNVFFYIIIIFLFLFAIFNINGGNGTENFPNIFGRGFLSVQSDSMNHDGITELEEWDSYPISDGFAKGDLLSAKTFDSSTPDGIKIGDVITYYTSDIDGNHTAGLITHRVVAVGDTFVIAQGDKLASEVSGTSINGKNIPKAYIAEGTDRYNSYKEQGMTDEEITKFNYTLLNSKIGQGAELVTASNIRGQVTGVTAGGGNVLDNIRKNYLFYFVMPVAVLLILEIFLVIRNIVILRGEKNKAELEDTREAMLKDVEAEKERIRQELLAEMRAQGLVSNDTEEKDKQTEEVKDESNDSNNNEAEINEPDNIIDELDKKSEEDSSNE